jgi:hypothetical protein
MRTYRWWLAIGLTCFSCGDPEYGGDRGALRLRFGLGGCSSTPASKSVLAKGGVTDLLVGDPKKHERLEVSSSSPDVVSVVGDGKITMTCDSKCEQTNGTAPLDVKRDGTATLTFSSEGAAIDSLTVKVLTATSIRLQNDKGVTGTVKARLGTSTPIIAKLFNKETELFTKAPFKWKVDGPALKNTTSTNGQTGFEPLAAGTSIVTASFEELSGSIQVVVEP